MKVCLHEMECHPEIFIFRLFVCDATELSQLVLDAETKLFRYRYSHSTAKERTRLLHTVSRHIEEVLFESDGCHEFTAFLGELNEVVKQLSFNENNIRGMRANANLH